jgi:FHA domain
MTENRSYRPGDWFGIFGDRATVVLPPSEKARVPGLWALVDAGAGFDEVLEALIADGLRDLPGFVLVSEADGETKVVLRGAATAVFTTAGETVTVEGSSVTTWAERSLTDVRTMRIDVADGPDSPDLVIRDGLVRISRTDRPAYHDEGHGQGHDEGEVTDEGEANDDGFEVIGGDDVSPDVNVMDETALRPGPEPLPEPEPEPEVGAETPLSDDPPTNPQEPTDGGHDGLTQGDNWGPDALARSQSGIPGQPPAPQVLAQPVARLIFSSGEVVDVDRAVIVGRAPEARRFTSTEQPRLITVPSPNQEISSTHLEIRPGAGADHGSAVATDLGSTNGTVLQQPGLPSEDLKPGIAVQLIPGAIIDLGDGVTIQVGQA